MVSKRIWGSHERAALAWKTAGGWGPDAAGREGGDQASYDREQGPPRATDGRAQTEPTVVDFNEPALGL